MRRFQGEKLKPGGRLAVISNDALGNFVVVTPLLQMLRAEFQPATLDYYGGVRTWELQTNSDLIDWTYPLHGSMPSELAGIAHEKRGYDLIVNIERANPDKLFAESLCTEDTFVCGPCGDGTAHDLYFADDERGQLWQDRDWKAEDLTQRYPLLKSPFIGEIFCRLCYLDGEIPPYKVPCEEPSIDIPPILISAAATLPEKLWPAEKWLQVLSVFKEKGLEIGLVGAHPIQQEYFWKGNDLEMQLLESGSIKDLRGKLSLPEVVGALHKAQLVLTLDNGILHLAVAARKKTVGIFRDGIHRLWAPPFEGLTVLTPPAKGQVQDLSVEAVRDAVVRAL
ncbi:MAG TPA: glycosyltransferase family 9 protein [Fimbriimonadaceae bacterium]